jgi:hypothetical protein
VIAGLRRWFDIGRRWQRALCGADPLAAEALEPLATMLAEVTFGAERWEATSVHGRIAARICLRQGWLAGADGQ